MAILQTPDGRPWRRLPWVRPATLFVLLSGSLVVFAIVHMYQREMDNGRRLTAAMAHLIAEQTSHTFQSLRALLREQEALPREVHHRVKNNLQVIHSKLRLEPSRSSNDARTVLLEMQARVQSIGLLHSMLYRVGRFASVDLGSYLRQLCHQAMRAWDDPARRIRLQLDLASVTVDMDQGMCCGLIVNELLSNCLKHGFPDGRDGEVRAALHAIDDGSLLRLQVGDDGVRLAPNLLLTRPATMGLQLVVDPALQLAGQQEVRAGSSAATCVTFARKYPWPQPPDAGSQSRPSTSPPAPATSMESR